MIWARRGMMQSLCALLAARPALAEEGDKPGFGLQPWRPGQLDIHHIATGRGDCSLIVMPDGTSLMIDAGAMYQPPPMDLALRPSEARRPGEWMARYAARRLNETRRTGLDYLLVTHIHPDHLGDVAPGLPRARDGEYRLTGVSDVAAALPIGVILDRGFPDYDWPAPQTAPFAQNYIAFIRARMAAGGKVARFQAGRGDQIGLAHDAAAFPSFTIRNLAANGAAWTGAGDHAATLLPASLKPEDVPDENVFSCALRIGHGAFRYFLAGDLTSNTLDGELPWRDVASPAAEACGPVDVAVAPHHGLFDSSSARLVRALRPRIWLIDAWHVSHPGTTTLERLFSTRLYPGPRDVLATGLSDADALVNARLTNRFASHAGHVVVRVAADGVSYRVVVTDNRDERDRVVKVMGPYPAG